MSCLKYFVCLGVDFIPQTIHCSKAKNHDLAWRSTEPKYLAFLDILDLVVVYEVLSHGQDKQRSSKMKRLFKGLNPNSFKLQSERKGCFGL